MPIKIIKRNVILDVKAVVKSGGRTKRWLEEGYEAERKSVEESDEQKAAICSLPGNETRIESEEC